MEAKPVVKTLADSLAKNGSQDTYGHQGEAEAEALLHALADTLAEIETDNFLQDSR